MIDVKILSVSLFLLLFELQTTNSQFPPHMDMNKVGEFVLNGQKYNLLKPTKHIITDYFKSFMLGEVRRNPNEKVYIDDNGFRHHWSNLEYNKSRKHYINQDTHTYNKIPFDIHTKVNKTKEIKEHATRKKPRRKKKVIEEEVVTEPSKEVEKPLREGSRTIATTTFFCPFFGVITMRSYLD